MKYIIAYSFFIIFTLIQYLYKLKFKDYYLYFIIYLIITTIALTFDMNYEILLTIQILYFISSIDNKKMIIPDLGLIFLIIIKVYSFIYSKISFEYSGIVYSLVLMLIIYILSKTKHKELIGFGDVKLLFILSFNVQVTFVIIMYLTASIIGLISMVIRKKKIIPFGPSICFGYFIIEIIIIITKNGSLM